MSSSSKKEKKKFGDSIRFYLTAFFILLATFSTFAFVFLVPFVIEPGFSTLFAEFHPKPVVCVTVDAVSKFGLSKCTWASCREGCTREVFKCTQIYVNYFKDKEGQYEGTNYTDPEEFENIKWLYEHAKIFPNIKGCGYPPDVNCTIFNKIYSDNGTTFPCYYSTLQPNVTITSLNVDEIKTSLIYSIALPWGCFIASVLYLLVTYAGMKKPEPFSAYVPKSASSSKASKEASNYSLRSIGKSINHGVNRLLREPDDKGCSKVEPRDDTTPLTLDSNLLLASGSLSNAFTRRNTLPPLERTPPIPRSASSRSEPTGAF